MDEEFEIITLKGEEGKGFPKGSLREEIKSLETEKRHLHQTNDMPRFKTEDEKQREFRDQQKKGADAYIDGIIRRSVERKLVQQNSLALHAGRLKQDMQNGKSLGEAYFNAKDRVGKSGEEFDRYLKELNPKVNYQKEYKEFLNKKTLENSDLSKQRDQERNKEKGLEKGKTLKGREFKSEDLSQFKDHSKNRGFER